MQHKQFDKAVHLLVEGKKISEVGSGAQGNVMAIGMVLKAM